MNKRYELENYKNCIVFDESILISDNFYQSLEHFRYRSHNSKEDFLVHKSEILKLQYYSVGKEVSFETHQKWKLIFYSNKELKRFLNDVNFTGFLTHKKRKLSKTERIIPIMIPAISGFVLAGLLGLTGLGDLIGVGQITFIILGLVVAIVQFLRNFSQSKLVIYKK